MQNNRVAGVNTVLSFRFEGMNLLVGKTIVRAAVASDDDMVSKGYVKAT